MMTTTRTTTSVVVRRLAAASLLVAMAAACGGLVVPTRSEPAFECRPIGRPAMGTILELHLCGAATAASFAESLFAEVDRLERIFSTWMAESEIERFHRSPTAEPFVASPELARILRESIELRDRTAGAFEPAVGALVRLWRQAEHEGERPTPVAVARARAAIGPRAFSVDDTGRLFRSGPDVRLDLGGIAKGWSIDRLAERLRAEHPSVPALIDFGRSSVVAIGAGSDGSGWRMALGAPGEAPFGTVALRDRSMSVSSSLGRVRSIEGREIGHMIDPVTGETIDRGVFACVIGPTATAAEAWSTALLVLGVPGLERLGDQGELEALVQTADGAVHRTSGFDAASGYRPAG